MAVNSALCAKGIADILSTHTLKMALIKGSPTGTYGNATANYSELGADEASGTGYTAGGVTLAGVTASVSSDGTVAWIDFTDPEWTGATFEASGAIIYSTTAGNRAVAVIAFGETLSPTNDTLTIQLPESSAALALIRLCAANTAPPSI